MGSVQCCLMSHSHIGQVGLFHAGRSLHFFLPGIGLGALGRFAGEDTPFSNNEPAMGRCPLLYYVVAGTSTSRMHAMRLFYKAFTPRFKLVRVSLDNPMFALPHSCCL